MQVCFLYCYKFILYKKKHFSFVTSWSVSFLIQRVRSCAKQLFTVYACAGTDTLAQERKAALICVPVTLQQRLFTSWYLFFCVCCACAKCLPHKLHVREWLQCRAHFRKNRPKKRQRTGWLPIAHYKQKPSGSDLWPVNWCIPVQNV